MTEKDSLPLHALPSLAIEVAGTCPKIPALIVTGTRCGKTGCRCRRGELHQTRYLRWREDGRHRRCYVRLADVEAVEAVLARRRIARAVERMTWQQAARQLEALEARSRELDEMCRGDA
jgi:hypothetical protein